MEKDAQVWVLGWPWTVVGSWKRYTQNLWDVAIRPDDLTQCLDADILQLRQSRGEPGGWGSSSGKLGALSYSCWIWQLHTLCDPPYLKVRWICKFSYLLKLKL